MRSSDLPSAHLRAEEIAQYQCACIGLVDVREAMAGQPFGPAALVGDGGPGCPVRRITKAPSDTPVASGALGGSRFREILQSLTSKVREKRCIET